MATTRRRPVARATTRALTPADLAWLALPPVALVMLAAVVLLGPAVGTIAFPSSGLHILPGQEGGFLPEPTEHARYVIALFAPVLLSGIVVLFVRRPLKLASSTVKAGVSLSQALTVLALAATVVVQQRTVFLHYYEDAQHVVYFTQRTLAVSAVLAALLALAIVRAGVAARAAQLLRERRWTRIAALLVAVAFVVAWELTAFNTERSIVTANEASSINFTYWLDETFSVLNGQPPLVGLNAQYGQLWPYLIAAVMSLTNTSFGVYCAVMCSGACAAMLAVFVTLRRVTRSSLAALGIWMPFVATSFFMERGPLDNRYGPANLFSLFPVRHGGPFLLAWLLSRQLDGERPRGRAPLLVLAGVVAINNVEFGIPAFGATFIALLVTTPVLDRAALLRLGRDGVIGVLGAMAAISVLTLAVAGSLPHFSMIFTFAKRYAADGFGMLPMISVGIHLAIFATFAGALALAAVRALRGEERVLTGLLAWAGSFGLGAGSYYVGRSHPEVLIDLFSAWALTVGLLLVHIVRSIRARGARRPTVIELAVLFAFGVTICSLGQMPTPWSQLHRLRVSPQDRTLFDTTREVREVAHRTRPGETVAIIGPLGHKIAYEDGVSDVMPYSDPLILYKEQLDEIVAALHAGGGHKIFLSSTYAADLVQRLGRRRFFTLANDSVVGLTLMSDARP